MASDIKNIKEFLARIGKYILGKFINSDKANDVKDLEDIGKTAWKFLLAIYEAYWNSLYIDKSKMSFRNKVKSKFNTQINKLLVNNKGKDMAKPTYILLLPPFILVKSSKEVNKISKYFKKMKNSHKRNHMLKFLQNLIYQMSL